MKQIAIILFVAVIGLASAAAGQLHFPLQVKHNRQLPTDPNDLNRIVGGTNVTNGGAPHQVAIFRSGGFLCGGSLIGSKSVLTAAHCVYG